MIAGADVAEPTDIARHGLVVPAGAAKQAPAVLHQGGGLQEEGFDAGLAVGQAVGQQRQVRLEPRIAEHRMVGFRIQRIVDRPTVQGPESPVGFHNRGAAAVGQHDVEPRQGCTKRVLGVRPQLRQGGWGVDVPEDAHRAGPGEVEHPEQGVVEHPDTARLDHHVRLGGPRHDLATAGFGRRPHHHFRPIRRIDIAVGLPLEGVRLIEGHLPALARQAAQQAPVVGGRAIPIGGEQARAIEGDSHWTASSRGQGAGRRPSRAAIASSSSAR